MIARVFHLAETDDKAIRRIGIAAILRWSDFPPHLQEQIVQQAMALADSDDELKNAIDSLLAETKTPAPKDRSGR